MNLDTKSLVENAKDDIKTINSKIPNELKDLLECTTRRSIIKNFVTDLKLNNKSEDEVSEICSKLVSAGMDRGELSVNDFGYVKDVIARNFKDTSREIRMDSILEVILENGFDDRVFADKDISDYIELNDNLHSLRKKIINKFDNLSKKTSGDFLDKYKKLLEIK